MKQKITNLIKESHSRSIKKRQEHRLFNIPVFIKDELSESVNIIKVINTVENLIPSFLTNNIEIIYIGQFQEMLDREVNAMYSNGAIYVTNIQNDNLDMIDDIIHEISHAVEESFTFEIYGDGVVENEFILKRSVLRRILKSYNYSVEEYDFLDPDWTREIDSFLYQDVGYPKLNVMVSGLFNSAYAATSLREYFANAFEEYFLGNRKNLSKISPQLYKKIDFITQLSS